MKKWTLMLTIFVVIIFCFGVYFLGGTSEQGDGGAGDDDSDFLGAKSSAVQLYGKNRSVDPKIDINSLHKKGKQTEEVSERNVRLHSLDCPTSFIRDGIYIWCDPDGLWSIFWKRGTEKLIQIELKSPDKISIINITKTLGVKTTYQNNKIEVCNQDDTKIGTMQFETFGAFIEVDVKLDNHQKVENFYIGSLLKNPSHLPVKISNRNNSASLSINHVKDNKEIFPHSEDRSSATLMPFNHSPGETK